MTNLTDKAIKAKLRARANGTYGDGSGLYLRIRDGRAVWLFRYKRHGRPRWMGLGTLAAVKLATARRKAAEARHALQDGSDPIEHRRERRRLAARSAHITFAAAADACFEVHQSKWKNPHYRDQWDASLKTHVLPVIGKLPVATVDTDEVLNVLTPIWTTRPTTARRVRNRIEMVLDWAKAKGHRGGDNPARWPEHLEELLPAHDSEVEHHAAIAPADIPAFMAVLREQDGIAARALELVTLTAVRSGSIIGGKREARPPMMWSHVDLASAMWGIPATKSDRALAVPLSPAALALLRRVKTANLSDVLVFPSEVGTDMPLGHSAMDRALKRIGGPYGETTTHGLRASFRTWAEDMLRYDAKVIKKAMGHKIGDALEDAYNRGDYLAHRRVMMNDWAAFCMSSAASDDKVVSLRSA